MLPRQQDIKTAYARPKGKLVVAGTKTHDTVRNVKYRDCRHAGAMTLKRKERIMPKCTYVEATTDNKLCDPTSAPSAREKLRNKQYALMARCTGYMLIGIALAESMTGKAYGAQIDITNINSILDFIGNIILVVGVVLAAWNLVQASQSFKDNQGFQMDKNVWGIIGGIGMAIAGGAMKTAGGLWGYGSAS